MCNLAFSPLCDSNTLSVFCNNNLTRQHSPVAEVPDWVGISSDSDITINDHLRHFQQALLSVCAQHIRKMGRMIFVFYSEDFSRVWVGSAV